LEERIPFFLGLLLRLGLLDFFTQGNDLRSDFFFCRHGGVLIKQIFERCGHATKGLFATAATTEL
jgi:hypothetical protein